MVLGEESRHRPTLDWADVPNDENLLYVDEDGQRHYRRYRTTVYNIEVEDYHTYCVDYPGILVHNQNCGAERRSRVDSLEIRGKKELSDYIGRNPEAHRGKVYLTDDIKLNVSSRDGVDYFSGLKGKEVGWEGYDKNRDSFKTTQLKGWGSLSHRVGNEIHLLAYSLPYRNPFKTAGSQDLNSIALGDVMVYPDLAAHPAARDPAPLTNTFGDIKKGPFGSPTGPVLDYARAMKDFDSQIARIRSRMEAGTLSQDAGQKEITKIMDNRSQYANGLPAAEKKRLLSAVHMLIRTSAALDFHDGAFKHMIIIQGDGKKAKPPGKWRNSSVSLPMTANCYGRSIMNTTAACPKAGSANTCLWRNSSKCPSTVRPAWPLPKIRRFTASPKAANPSAAALAYLTNRKLLKP